MNVAMILEEGRLGGPQIYATLVAYALKKQIKTTLILPSDISNSFKQRLQDSSGVAYQTFKITRITNNLFSIIQYVLLFLIETYRIYGYFKRERFDIVYSAGGSWQYKGLIAGKLAKTKVVWHLNDTYMPFVIRGVFSILSGFADAYIFASERTKKYYLPLIQKERVSFIIPQPVDTSYFSTDIIPNRNDDTLLYRNKIVIGTVASINPIKGLDVLVKAIPRLNNIFNNLLFVVVGPVYKSQTKYFKSLKTKILELGIDNIQFAGAQYDIRLYLENFDIFVCTSFFESGPMTLWEAMSMEKAVVTTDVGDVSKYVLSGYSGEVVEVGDVDGLVEKIREFIVDEKKRSSFGSRAREIVNQNLDVSICAKKHLQAFQRVIEL
jgi:glycosyltransferase involved in cell wall biosynthesis